MLHSSTCPAAIPITLHSHFAIPQPGKQSTKTGTPAPHSPAAAPVPWFLALTFPTSDSPNANPRRASIFCPISASSHTSTSSSDGSPTEPQKFSCTLPITQFFSASMNLLRWYKDPAKITGSSKANQKCMYCKVFRNKNYFTAKCCRFR